MVPDASFAFESGTRFGYEPAYRTWPADDGTDPALYRGPAEEVAVAEEFVKMLVQSQSVPPDDLLDTVRTEVGDTLTATHSQARRLRAGRDQRGRGDQGEHAAARAAPGSASTPARLPPSGTCRMMSTCSAGRECRTSWPTPIPPLLALDFPVVPGNDESGVGRTILGWLSPHSRLMPAALARVAVLRGVAICLPRSWSPSTSAPPRSSAAPSVPWRPIMVDLDVYRLAGSVLLEGGDFYNLPGRLPFLYPPFAALLAVPLAVLPATLVQVAWTAAGAVALVAMLLPLRADRLGAQPGRRRPRCSSSSRWCRPWRSASSASSWSPWWRSTWPPDRGCCPGGCCPRDC